MRLFDGSEDYELDSFHVHCSPNKVPVIHVNIVKDVNCQAQLEPFGGTKVIHVGKERNHPDINRFYLNLFIMNVGHFNVHPISMADHDRFDQLMSVLETFRKGTLSLTVRLKGDEVKDECQMKPFEIQLRAMTPRHWSHMLYDMTKIVDPHTL